MWSVGVILYNMATSGDRLLVRDQFDLEGDELQEFVNKRVNSIETASGNLKDLMLRLLVVDPLKRYKSYLALNHPWVNNADYPPPLLLYQEEGKFMHTRYLKKVHLGFSDIF